MHLVAPIFSTFIIFIYYISAHSFQHLFPFLLWDYINISFLLIHSFIRFMHIYFLQFHTLFHCPIAIIRYCADNEMQLFVADKTSDRLLCLLSVFDRNEAENVNMGNLE